MHIHFVLVFFSIFFASSSLYASQEYGCFVHDRISAIDTDAVNFLATKGNPAIVKKAVSICSEQDEELSPEDFCKKAPVRPVSRQNNIEASILTFDADIYGIERKNRGVSASSLAEELCAKVAKNDIAGVQLLLNGKADINAKNSEGHTPLMCEALRKVEGQDNNNAMAEMLLKCGADISYNQNERNNYEKRSTKIFDNNHPLALAVLNHRNGLCQLLLGANANPAMQGAKGYATVRNHAHILWQYEKQQLARSKTTQLTLHKIEDIYTMLHATTVRKPRHLNDSRSPQTQRRGNNRLAVLTAQRNASKIALSVLSVKDA